MNWGMQFGPYTTSDVLARIAIAALQQPKDESNTTSEGAEQDRSRVRARAWGARKEERYRILNIKM